MTHHEALILQNVQESSLRERLVRLKKTWAKSIVNFCLIYMFGLGLLFTFNLFRNVIPKATSWGLWGEASLAFFGVLFICLSIYGLLYPERGAGIVATFVLAGLGMVTSAKVQFNPAGLLFWGMAFIGAVVETLDRVGYIETWKRWWREKTRKG